jgi:hypothetical protein
MRTQRQPNASHPPEKSCVSSEMLSSADVLMNVRDHQPKKLLSNTAVSLRKGIKRLFASANIQRAVFRIFMAKATRRMYRKLSM